MCATPASVGLVGNTAGAGVDMLHDTDEERAPLASIADLARAAAQSGVAPPLSDTTVQPAGALQGSNAFQSNAVRFAVTIAERLAAASTTKEGSPSAESCYTCLSILREMLPLLGPLGPVLQNVHDALQLCLLSDQHYGDIEVVGSDCGAGSSAAQVSAAGMAGDSQTPRAIGRGALFGSPSPRVKQDGGAGEGTPRNGNPAWRGSGGEDPARRTRSHSAASSVRFNRVPYFVLVRKLEEANEEMRRERDASIRAVSDHQKELSDLNAQLSEANAQLDQKTSSIQKLMAEQAMLESELRLAREVTKREEHKHDVLQAECIFLTREFLTNTQRLEGEVDKLRAENDQLQGHDL